LPLRGNVGGEIRDSDFAAARAIHVVAGKDLGRGRRLPVDVEADFPRVVFVARKSEARKSTYSANVFCCNPIP
jgi:hypothetical protein